MGVSAGSRGTGERSEISRTDSVEILISKGNGQIRYLVAPAERCQPANTSQCWS